MISRKNLLDMVATEARDNMPTDRDRETLKQVQGWLRCGFTDECPPPPAADLDGAITRLLERLEAAESKYQFMVDRAAGEHLEGYRELGERAAKAERERDAWMSSSKDHHDEAKELRAEVERLRASKKHWQDVTEKHSDRADDAEDKTSQIEARIEAALGWLEPWVGIKTQADFAVENAVAALKGKGE